MSRSVHAEITLDEAFHHELWAWYSKNRSVIRSNYPGLAQRFLEYNAPLDRKSKSRFLREPQAQALEMYVFLKERMVERSAGGRAERAWPVHEIFEKWYRRETPFATRDPIGMSVDSQQGLFEAKFGEAQYVTAFKRMRESAGSQEYGNYIFALTMGTGKTLLMATCIFYDFLMANAYPKDKRYALNALIFAPDKTVLATLRRDIEQFDRRLVVPPEYLHVIETAEARFLEEDGATLTGLRARFNIIVSNAQKIILKRNQRGTTAGARFFAQTPRVLEAGSADARAQAMFDTDEVMSETELVTNQRYETLRRMPQLGVFIDEAHHVFGADLLADLDPSKATSLRRTVDLLAADLAGRGSRVVGCYNYTGTPYAKGQVFPEVVYAYGLKRAIDAGYLKDVEVQHVDQERVIEAKFLRDAVTDFLSHHNGLRYEGMLPKLAVFVPKVADIEPVRRTLLEVLAEAGVSGRSVLVNVGDGKHTTSEDIRAFNLLDTPESDKQFILLVGKGKEGWNCRSLFGVVLYRRPTSKVFVLQASMRCLRAIDHPPRRTGRIYLSTQCKELLDQELHENYKLTVEDLKGEPSEKRRVEVRPVPPIPRLKIRRTRHLWDLHQVEVPEPPTFGFSDELVERYRVLRTIQTGLRGDGAEVASRTEVVDMEDRPYTGLMLVAEISRYLNRRPVEIESLLERTPEGLDEVVRWVSLYNALLHDHVIPELFRRMYTLESWEKPVEDEVLLVREPPAGGYIVHAAEEKIFSISDHEEQRDRSFHLDHYCFDSEPELQFFLSMLHETGQVEKVYFTGMLTNGQTDFYIDYIDPLTHGIRSYYPDFLVFLRTGQWIVIEVKGDNRKDDPVVLAKAESARRLLHASGIEYRMILGSQVMAGDSVAVLQPGWMRQLGLQDV